MHQHLYVMSYEVAHWFHFNPPAFRRALDAGTQAEREQAGG
jgi:hypothetical protein